MSDKNKYEKIHKNQFETVLKNTSNYAEFPPNFYIVDDAENKTEKLKVVQEYCYVLEIDSEKGTCLKIYSSIRKDTDVSRDVDTDAIRIVAANLDSGKPIRPQYPIVKRIPNWRNNLRIRISEIMQDLGTDMRCAKGHLLFLKKRPDATRYLLCSKYPECKGSRNL
jgi:hypothetical protein